MTAAQTAIKPKRVARPAATYRANRPHVRRDKRQPALSLLPRRDPPKCGTSWPNPQNMIQGRRECARRIRQVVAMWRRMCRVLEKGEAA